MMRVASGLLYTLSHTRCTDIGLFVYILLFKCVSVHRSLPVMAQKATIWTSKIGGFIYFMLLLQTYMSGKHQLYLWTCGILADYKTQIEDCNPRNKITFKQLHLNVRVTSTKRFCYTFNKRKVVNFFSCFFNVCCINCIESTVNNFILFDIIHLHKTFIKHRINVCIFYYIDDVMCTFSL